ncbi:MBL fold metallo-hydrolase [Vibrio sinaloensis]|uniref:MBL fold metallo-hydrolase n=1 Tax=Photobacterium sp. (strain ATCC 43367) TaxID=379097 RepID=UPI00057D4970|nr:MBL fold metallo-hydrolase [Vibrio sinaloensis]KHT35910.1 hydrolase [Vibrio sinaloensis]
MKFAMFALLGLLVAIAFITLGSNKNRFQNSEIAYSSSLGDTLRILHAFITTPRLDPTPTQPLPIQSMNEQALFSTKRDSLYRIGHSSVLLNLDDNWILTDPVLSERASPVQWAGPKRFHPSPINASNLPPIDIVIISHDHYDHLDKNTIQAIAKKVGTFVTPLKVGDLLVSWGVAPEKVVQLDWWQSTFVNGIELVATPSQHFSGRGLLDRNQTLWSSWVILGTQHRVFFSGDSGYFSGFESIGKRYGPFDVTLIESGAYNSLWQDIHMMPDESVQAHIDLRGKYMIPIHNGTFDLSMHPWYEPLERITDISSQRGVQLITPAFGQLVELDSPPFEQQWWKTESIASEPIPQFEPVIDNIVKEKSNG